ncbi:hypothetical protein A1Q1_01902 [Trichosporon asahii var. asahii CBS 2479]|uniref:Uncharacterized protein n=1 Tax=Trichosporon asahii var. asahii (strain ATCC 90039 / CBS 2479 / JCM 2466 / KCTC 7840 / NBRC 103889/ NCYC 2677 / UAMH 7654) TaxID=1186058 RepID=J5T3S9_TRIAS|nr:hypothetical protein A1Q1_01902 [Trichosporon asahii var. asahii CBS 2479]EJT48991.1 hypothetical protein A1Q1_01902 [Trichosporon asahii var. asahii CBS 2479]
MFGRLIYILTLALSVVAWPAETGTQLYLLGGTCLNLEGLVDYGAKPILPTTRLRLLAAAAGTPGAA